MNSDNSDLPKKWVAHLCGEVRPANARNESLIRDQIAAAQKELAKGVDAHTIENEIAELTEIAERVEKENRQNQCVINELESNRRSDLARQTNEALNQCERIRDQLTDAADAALVRRAADALRSRAPKSSDLASCSLREAKLMVQEHAASVLERPFAMIQKSLDLANTKIEGHTEVSSRLEELIQQHKDLDNEIEQLQQTLGTEHGVTQDCINAIAEVESMEVNRFIAQATFDAQLELDWRIPDDPLAEFRSAESGGASDTTRDDHHA